LQRLRDAAVGEVPLERGYSPRDWTLEERVGRFTERLRAVRAEVHPCSRDAWPRILVDAARARGLTNLLFSPTGPWGPQLLAEPDFNSPGAPRPLAYGQPIEEWKHSLFFEVDAALTSSLGGIAETGTLVLWPTPQEPRSMSLVPPVHFVILEAQRLYATFAQMVREQDWSGGMPSNALLISGPSKTADIEQTLAYGVHGPKELIVLLIE